MTQLLTVSDAARALGLTPAAVKNHDDELAPERTESGRRIYHRARVEAFAARRDAARDRGVR